MCISSSDSVIDPSAIVSVAIDHTYSIAVNEDSVLASKDKVIYDRVIEEFDPKIPSTCPVPVEEFGQFPTAVVFILSIFQDERKHNYTQQYF